MPDADGVLTHEEVIAGSLEAPVDLETNLLFIAQGSGLFFVVLLVFLIAVFSLAHMLKALDRKISGGSAGGFSLDEEATGNKSGKQTSTNGSASSPKNE